MTRFSIIFAFTATFTTGCVTTQTATERREAAYQQLINEEVPDGISFKRKAPSGPTLVVTTKRRVKKRTNQVVANATPRSTVWIAGQGSTDPDDQPIIGKPGEIVEISFE